MPSNVLKFDESSGQVYTETTVSIQSTADRNWSHELHIKPLKTRSGKARCKGSRSLSNLATDGIIDNLGDLTLEWVQELPQHLKLRIWELANERSVNRKS